VIKKKVARRISIRTRITLLMFAYIAAVFLVVLIAFNLIVHEYIKSTVNEQLHDYLQAARIEQEQFIESAPEDTLTQDRILISPAVISQPSRGLVGKTEAIIISEDYELIFPDLGNLMFFDLDEIAGLINQLQLEQVDLTSNNISQLRVSGREFYLVSIPVQNLFYGETAYLVSYIDMTTITNFTSRINAVLLVVMGLAVIFAAVIAAFLSGVIAKPIRELTRFAGRIGKGDFSKSSVTYQELELAELAESMNTAAGRLDSYDREQKTFFQNVSHELRTPLQSIRCSAEGIEHGILEQQAASRVIITETDRLSEMVEDLLYLSRIDNISGDDLATECDLREILSNCAERQRGVAAERGLKLDFNFDPYPVNYICSNKHLSRAFTNLISNAIRYARTTITLSCVTGKDEVIIEVKDDGPGIDEKDLPFVYNRFYKGRGGNHGIGLAIVKTVVEQHKGSIAVKSDSKGSVFTITLPF
jgi:two-component system, OmpR family, sensor histidine kinase CssS